MNLKNLIVIGLVAVLGGCISIETTESQEGKQQFSTQQESSPTPTPTVERIVIRDSVKVTSTESSAVGTGVKHLTLGDTVKVEAVDELPEAQVYRGETTLYENGEPVGKIEESSIGVIDGYMRVKDSAFTYLRRDTSSEIGSKLKKGRRIAVRDLKKGFYNLTVKYNEFIPAEDLVSEVSYWNTVATSYDLWVDMLWKEIYSKRQIFTGYSWSWREDFDKQNRPEEITFVYELSVDRIKWFRLSRRKKENMLNNAYSKLRKNFNDFEKNAKYCPVIIFEISGPRIQETKVAESNCEEGWFYRP